MADSIVRASPVVLSTLLRLVVSQIPATGTTSLLIKVLLVLSTMAQQDLR